MKRGIKMNGNSNRQKVFRIFNMIFGVLGCSSLVYLQIRLFRYLFSKSYMNLDDAVFVFSCVLAVITGTVFALLLLINTIGAFSVKANNAVLRIEGSKIGIPIAEIIFLIIYGLFLAFVVLGLIIADLFELSGWVILVYPILFMLLLVEIGFTIASKFRLLDYKNAQRKANRNNVMQNVNVPYQPVNNSVPQSANDYPQYQQQNYPQYPQAAQSFQPEIRANNDYNGYQ